MVYHSGYGHTHVQAEAVVRGARSVAGVEVSLIAVDAVEDNWAVLDGADAMIFGSPTYMGGVSAPFKAFMDSTSGRFYSGAWRDKIAAGFTNSASQSGDKLATLQALSVFAMQQSMIWVGLGLPPGNNVSTGSVEDLNRLGSFLGAMAQSNGDVGPDVAPPSSDQRTAEALGRRVAEATLRWMALPEAVAA